MAVLAIAAVGAVAGGAVGAGFGAVALGASIGWMAGSFLGNLFFGPDAPSQEGPRLTDLNVQSSAEGVGLPIVFGRARIAGNVIWAQPIKETRHEEEVGGKGMGGGGTQVSYTYSVSFAIGICEGPIIGVRKIWADSKLIYDNSSGANSETVIASQDRARAIRIYFASETQTADPTIQSFEGAANTPAYRGLAYLVFEDLELADFANHLPNITIEVVTAATYGGAYDVFDTPVTGASSVTFANYLNGEVNMVAVPTAGSTHTVYTIFPNGTTLTGAVISTPGESQCSGNSDVPAFITKTTNLTTVYLLSEDGASVIDTHSFIGFAASRCFVRDGYAYMSGLGFNGIGIYKTKLNGLNVPVFQLWDGLSPSIPNAAQFCVGHRYIYIFEHTPKKIHVYDLNFGFVKTISFTPTEPPTFYISGLFTPLMATDDDRFLYLVSAQTPGFMKAYYHRIDIETGAYTFLNTSNGSYFFQQGYGGFAVRGDLLILQTSEGPTLNDGDYLELSHPRAIIPQNVALSTIVSNLCVRTGLSAGDMNTAALTNEVAGYVIPRPITARAAMEQLRQAYFFDGVESDGKVVFVKRGGASAATLVADDLGVREPGAESPAPIRISRAQELELPAEIHLQYLDMDNDYLPGSQYARRLTTQSKNQISIDLPLALSSTQAAQIADVLMRNAWVERNRFSFALTRKFAYLDPSDNFTVPTPQGLALARLTRTDYGASGVLACEALADDTVLYSSSVAGNDSGVNTPQTLSLAGPTRLELLDIPILRDQDDNCGFYVAACGYLGGWKGAVLYRSVDGSVTWSAPLALLAAATIGQAESVLGNLTGGNVWDKGNVVNVTLFTPGATLATATELAVLAGANTAAIGAHGRWEIIQFLTVTSSGGIYTLKNLLRGRRGTEWAMGTHAVGDSFVLLSETSLRRLEVNSSEIGLSRDYRGVSIGKSIESVSSRAFTLSGMGLECLSPANIGGGRDASDDIIINWERRTRIGGEWRDYVDASLGETAENYEAEIWTTDFVTLKRTITGLTAKTTTYTSAQQVTDFGSNQASVGVKVYQLSATVGRGIAGSALV